MKHICILLFIIPSLLHAAVISPTWKDAGFHGSYAKQKQQNMDLDYYVERDPEGGPHFTIKWGDQLFSVTPDLSLSGFNPPYLVETDDDVKCIYIKGYASQPPSDNNIVLLRVASNSPVMQFAVNFEEPYDRLYQKVALSSQPKNSALRSFNLTSKSQEVIVSGRWCTADNCDRCTSVPNARKWGDNEGVRIDELNVKWTKNGRIVKIPSDNLCGLLNTLEGRGNNPLGLEVVQVNSDMVVISNMFYPDKTPYRCIWVIWKNGTYDFVPIDGLLLTPAMYTRGFE